ncbi:hypothetical protein ACU686_32955 [Yinghuangia aomiensis]
MDRPGLRPRRQHHRRGNRRSPPLRPHRRRPLARRLTPVPHRHRPRRRSPVPPPRPPHIPRRNRPHPPLRRPRGGTSAGPRRHPRRPRRPRPHLGVRRHRKPPPPATGTGAVPASAAHAASGARHVGRDHIAAAEALLRSLSLADDAFGGGHGRHALAGFLGTVVTDWLRAPAAPRYATTSS